MIPLAPLDVVLAKVRRGRSDNPCRCIVIMVCADAVVLAPCSSNFDLCQDSRDFLIHDYDADFGATLLDCSTYVIANEETPWVERECVGKKYGRLTGDLARRFREWYGLEQD